MPVEKTRKMVLRWSVLFALVHLILLVCIYGLDVPKAAVSLSPLWKNAPVLFEATRWFDPLAWPILGAFFLFVLVPVHSWTEHFKTRKTRSPEFVECLVFAATACAVGFSVGGLIIGIVFAVSRGFFTVLVLSPLVGLMAGLTYGVLYGGIVTVICLVAWFFDLIERTRLCAIPIVAWCLRPFKNLLGFLNAEDEKEDYKW